MIADIPLDIRNEPIKCIEKFDNNQNRKSHGHRAVILESCTALLTEITVHPQISAFPIFGCALHKSGLKFTTADIRMKTTKLNQIKK